ncbi:hypothetical protein H696_00366 [Fonticula alba]|uniref:Topoisomerase I damage affected protein 2 n=1 Tax=Fonticula alba TaxID=691883 RepID=A0A058ZH27_FONAL|nr:hypothetical protein H696_00366 [Fonticula alba]KCV72787.1 hypothetical protein H696_00366 [Fonticula alba]|eukprot:XP_009492488.1 hypothetical protein H696_00366 [Fonticula alba]
MTSRAELDAFIELSRHIVRASLRSQSIVSSGDEQPAVSEEGLSRRISSEVLEQLKEHSSTKYKFIVNTFSVKRSKNSTNGINAQALCYWDASQDAHVEELFENENFIIHCSVFILTH